MDHTYTIQEVAAKLNLSDKTLRRWEEAGRFRSSRTLGNQRRYSIEDVQILDAIKHGTINSQSELLSLEQAANFCGVSKVTFSRWEDEGKIHPLITSGNTYYPRERLAAKLSSLQTVPQVADDPRPTTYDLQSNPLVDVQSTTYNLQPPTTPPAPKLAPLPLPKSTTYDLQPTTYDLRPILTQTLITVLLLVVYHLVFNSPSISISPSDQGSVQGAKTTAATPDPRIDDLVAKYKEHMAQDMQKNSKPALMTTINLDNTSLISGTGTLVKGKDQISVPSDKITPTTPVTITFNSDYAPAKKSWVTIEPGQFTVHTDFAVATDTSFTYSFVATTVSPTNPISTPSASPAVSTSSAVRKN